MKKYFYIDHKEVPLYRGYLVTVLSNDIDKVTDVLPSWDKNEPIYAHSWFENYKGKQGFFVVLNFDNSKRKVYHGTVAHECLHAVNFILNHRGLSCSHDNDEASTYLLEWVVDSVYSVLRKHNLNPS